jgi:hypothetical protein
MSIPRLSTGTKLASKTPKKSKKVSVLDLVPVLRVQKQLKKIFQKSVKMYLVTVKLYTGYSGILLKFHFSNPSRL